MSATNLEIAKQRSKELENRGTYSKVPYWRPKEGTNNIRILPPYGSRETCWEEFKAVFGVGPNNKKVVPRAQFGLDDCPFEAYIEALNQRDDEASKRERASVRISNRVSFIVIDRYEESVGPQVWETNVDNLAEICSLMSNPEWGAIDDPENGVDLVLVYTPKEKTANKFPEWRIQPSRNSTSLSPVKDNYDNWLSKDWFEEFRVGRPSDVDWIKAVLSGTDKEFNASQNSAAVDKSAEVGQSTLPPPPAAPATEAKAEVVTAPYPFAPDCPFYVYVNDAAQNMDAQSLYKLVCDGQDPQCCAVSAASGGWKAASELGFKKPETQAPPPPPALGTNGVAKDTAPWKDLPPNESDSVKVDPAIGDNTVADDIREQLSKK